jgi:TonB family protein
MHNGVSDILIDRSREADGLNRMVIVSLVAHGVLLTAIVLMPAGWWSSPRAADETAMMISLAGGAPGPDSGGMTQISAAPVQSVAPDASPAVRPAPAKPEMVAPEPDVKVKPAPAKPVEKPADKSSSRKPTAGPEIKSGAARVPTQGVAVPFGGLSSSGGAGFGETRIDGDFCCPDYIQTMNRLIYTNWNQHQGAAGLVEVKFTIRRDGMLTNVEVAKTSNNPLLDLESRRAVLVTQKLPPLPEQFDRPSLTVYMLFVYKR